MAWLVGHEVWSSGAAQLLLFCSALAQGANLAQLALILLAGIVLVGSYK